MTKYLAALIGIALASAPPANAAPPPDAPTGMTSSQFQSLACLATGTLGSLIAYAYTDFLVVTGGVVVNPVLIFAPVMATGFAFGCSVGANAAPGVYWLHMMLR